MHHFLISSEVDSGHTPLGSGIMPPDAPDTAVKELKLLYNTSEGLKIRFVCTLFSTYEGKKQHWNWSVDTVRTCRENFFFQ